VVGAGFILGLQLISKIVSKTLPAASFLVPPAVVFVSFIHRGHKFIKKIELANFFEKNIHLIYGLYRISRRIEIRRYNITRAYGSK